MTDEQRARLQAAIVEWRKAAEVAGSMHPLWDSIFEAKALLAGKRTLLDGTPDEIFQTLMKGRQA